MNITRYRKTVLFNFVWFSEDLLIVVGPNLRQLEPKGLKNCSKGILNLTSPTPFVSPRGIFVTNRRSPLAMLV